MALSAARPSMASVLAELARLGRAALQIRCREVFGHRPKRDNEHHLRTTLAKALTATSGPLPSLRKPTYGKAERQERDHRLPSAGAVVIACVGGRQHLVTVLERSWNGLLLFGLERSRGWRCAETSRCG